MMYLFYYSYSTFRVALEPNFVSASCFSLRSGLFWVSFADFVEEICAALLQSITTRDD